MNAAEVGALIVKAPVVIYRPDWCSGAVFFKVTGTVIDDC